MKILKVDKDTIQMEFTKEEMIELAGHVDADKENIPGFAQAMWSIVEKHFESKDYGVINHQGDCIDRDHPNFKKEDWPNLKEPLKG